MTWAGLPAKPAWVFPPKTNRFEKPSEDRDIDLETSDLLARPPAADGVS
jgi:hypothetical protein